MDETVYPRQSWRIWVCRCPGRFWPERPSHYSCADCGRLISQIEVVQGTLGGGRR
jgi:hypothetical protein